MLAHMKTDSQRCPMMNEVCMPEISWCNVDRIMGMSLIYLVYSCVYLTAP